MSRTYPLVAFSIAILLGVSGCGSATANVELADVAGTVELDGKPLESGEVVFVLLGEHSALIPIKKGTFSGEAGVGENRVEIYSYRSGGEVVEMGGEKFGGEEVNFIPPKYNASSSLTATVTAEGNQGFAFEVTSK